MRRLTTLIIVALSAALTACALTGATGGGEPPIRPAGPIAAAAIFTPESVELGKLTEGRSEPFTLTLTNVSGKSVEITEIVPSCGCTVVEYQRGAIAPGSSLSIKGHIDTTGKIGPIDKSLAVYTSLSPEPFNVSLKADVLHDGSSVKGVDTAMLFKGQCASCHSPKGGLTGEPLYKAVCLMCHKQGLSQNAALDRRSLESIIAAGVSGTSMPAYALAHEGPLTNAQIASLADYILQCFNSSSHPSDAPGAKAAGLLDATGGIPLDAIDGKGLCAEGAQPQPWEAQPHP